MRRMIRIRFFQEFAQHCAFIERLILVLQGRYEAARVEVEEGLGFVVWVYFDVLVGDFLFFEDDPGALDEGAEPAGVEL